MRDTSQIKLVPSTIKGRRQVDDSDSESDYDDYNPCSSPKLYPSQDILTQSQNDSKQTKILKRKHDETSSSNDQDTNDKNHKK